MRAQSVIQGSKVVEIIVVNRYAIIERANQLYIFNSCSVPILILKVQNSLLSIFIYSPWVFGGPDYDLLGPQANEIMGPPQTEPPLDLPAPVLNIFYSQYILTTFTQLKIYIFENLLAGPIKLDGPQAASYSSLQDNPAPGVWLY